VPLAQRRIFLDGHAEHALADRQVADEPHDVVIHAGVHEREERREMAWFQNITIILKFLPLLFIAIVGWFFVDT
jgi:hypothetical protein